MKSFLFIFLLFLSSGAGAETNSPLLRYAQVYERELAGDAGGALADYRDLLQVAPPLEAVMTEKVLYRIGVCERRLGHVEATRQAWRKLVQDFPARDPEVVRTREELKDLERELDRVMIEGRVGEGTGRVAFVFAGEWGDEPVVLADTNGRFRVERKVAGQASGGERYSLVYAEHPDLPLVAAEAIRVDRSQESGVRSQEARTQTPTQAPAQISMRSQLDLLPALSLYGNVVDSLGRPVPGAMILVTGYKSDIPFPFDRLLPPVVSATNGEFSIAGLVPGFRYVVTASKSGCRMVTAAERDTNPGDKDVGASSASCGSIVLQQLGEISLRGRIVDESGAAVQAEVAAWSLPPVDREVARVSSDSRGLFIFRDLRENAVTLKVEGEGFLPRSLTGLKPMGQEIDMVLKGNGLSEKLSGKVAKGGGAQAQRDVLALEGEVQAVPSGGAVQLVSRPNPLPLQGLLWLRGNPESGSPLLGRDLGGHVVVIHFRSSYVESAVRSQYPGEPGPLSQLMRLYSASGLICLWALPEGESRGEAARIALELYPDLPVASLPRAEDAATGILPASVWSVESGNIVMGRDGLVRTACSDQQLFKAVKAAIAAKP